MQGTLDLSAHRLDAWITSFATRRLAAMRVDGPKGQYVGALRLGREPEADAAHAVKPVTTPPAGEPGPLSRRPTTAASSTRRR